MDLPFNTSTRIIPKPWGQEEWIELNDRYCFKRLTVKAGKRTSLQYHNKKVETMYVLSGKGELTLQGEGTEKLEKIIVEEGDRITISPPRIHRMSGITDVVYLEASTPEVEDVVRLEDDYRREGTNAL